MPGDDKSIKHFTDVVRQELITYKQHVNFVIADGSTFKFPLEQMGKSLKDLHLLVIDSFRHSYMFPRHKDMFNGGLLKQFLQDLYSGKLHREFHYGPDTPSGNEENKDGTGPGIFKNLSFRISTSCYICLCPPLHDSLIYK